MPKEEKESKRRFQPKGDKKFTGFKDHRERQLKIFTNDPEFYWKYPKLAELAARLAFGHRNGANTALLFSNTGVVSTAYQNIDGIIAQPYLMTPGFCKSMVSGINTASQAAWKMLNRRFRGVSKYATPDFGIIQFAIVDFAVHISEAERIYGVLNYYSVNNLTVPNYLLYAMGVNPESFSDLSDFRLQLNRLLLRAKTLCLVRGYSLLDHFLYLSSNIFKDRDSNRAQLIVPVSKGYWKYTGTRFSTGSALEFVPHSHSDILTLGVSNKRPLRSQNDILKDLNDQMYALLDDDDVDNVCSDILAYYGNKDDSADIVKFQQIPEEYTVSPIYSIAFLKQWHNATLLPDLVTTTSTAGVHTDTVNYYTDIHSAVTDSGSGNLFIYQYNNVINFNLHYATGTINTRTQNGIVEHWSNVSSTGEYIRQPIVDSDLDSPDAKEIMEITRYTVPVITETATISGVAHSRITCDAFASAIFFEAITYVFKDCGESPAYTAADKSYAFANLDYSSLRLGQGYGPNETRFDWLPITYYKSGTTLRVYGDLNNYVPVSPEVLDAMHEVALLSEFKNPITDLLLKED